MAFIEKITRPPGPTAGGGRNHDDRPGRAFGRRGGSAGGGDHLAGARTEGAGL
ncbi:hypothetical protein ACIG5D_11075 [Microbispora rosea]|uniref:hypothetical protein n=1 Tax=Microbispora rosea TaxID=58117 RepID=UPI0037CA28C4